jgi:hypothetical protein
MANIFKIKRTKTPGKKPTTTQLQEGELALNLKDEKIFTSDGAKIIELGKVDYASNAEVLAGTVNDKVIAPDTLAANSVSEIKTGGLVSIDVTFSANNFIDFTFNTGGLTELEADYELKWSFNGNSGTIAIPKGYSLVQGVGLGEQFKTTIDGGDPNNFINQFNSNYPTNKGLAYVNFDMGQKFTDSIPTERGCSVLISLLSVKPEPSTFKFSFAPASKAGPVKMWVRTNSSGVLDANLISAINAPTTPHTDDEGSLIKLNKSGLINTGFLGEMDAGTLQKGVSRTYAVSYRHIRGYNAVPTVNDIAVGEIAIVSEDRTSPGRTTYGVNRLYTKDGTTNSIIQLGETDNTILANPPQMVNQVIKSSWSSSTPLTIDPNTDTTGAIHQSAPLLIANGNDIIDKDGNLNIDGGTY